jgi:hypothetical protein
MLNKATIKVILEELLKPIAFTKYVTLGILKIEEAQKAKQKGTSDV